MSELIAQYQYVLAWLIYLVAALVFCLAWWKLTSNLRHAGWRDLFRGLALVFIFTPWYVNESHEHPGPAVLVVMMDLLSGGTDNLLAGFLVLLLAMALLLVVLIVRRRPRRGQDE